MDADQPRLADLVGSLSLATDLGAGLALETALRTALLAVRLGRLLDLRGEALSEIYYTGLLRFIGCTAYAHETAALGGGDDLGLLRTLTPADAADPTSIMRQVVRGSGWGVTRLQRAGAVVQLATHPDAGRRL